MTNVKIRKPIVVKKITGKTFKETFRDEPFETVSYGFGQLEQYSNYRPKISKKLKAELEELEKEWDKEPLPF